MGKIDKEKALGMMNSGTTDTQIAAYFGTSRQAVNLLRKAFTGEGKLIHQKGTGISPPPVDIKQSNIELPSKQTPQAAPSAADSAISQYPSFEQISDWLVHIINEAGEARELRHINKAQETTLHDLRSEISQLQQDLQEMRQRYNGTLKRAEDYQQAIRKLGLPPIDK